MIGSCNGLVVFVIWALTQALAALGGTAEAMIQTILSALKVACS